MRKILKKSCQYCLCSFIRAGLSASLCLWPASPPAQASASEPSITRSCQESGSLELNKPIERDLSGGLSHFYKIRMPPGQFLHIVVKQQGIDVSLALHTPDDKKIGEADSNQSNEGSETMSTISESAGAYLIVVRSLEKTAKAGRYEIKVEELRAATAEDKYRVAGESVFREAELLKIGTLEAKRKSIEKYNEALDLYRRAGDRRQEAITLNNVGMIHGALGEMEKALDKYNEALPITRAVGDRLAESDTLSAIGTVYWSIGDTQKALENYKEVLAICRAIGARGDEAITLNNIGTVYWSLGDTQKALEQYNAALPIIRAIRDRSAEASTINNIGAVYLSLGEMQKTVENLNEAMSIRRAIGDRAGVGIALANISAVYWSSGEIQKALEKLNEALPIARAMGDRSNEATILNNFGRVYNSLGESRTALEKLNEALSIARDMGDRAQETIVLNNLGRVYYSMGELQKAQEKYSEAMPISRETGAREDEATTLHGIGLVCSSLGETQKALEKFNEALLIYQAISARSGEAYTLLGIARAERKRGNLTQARQTIERAISMIELMRTTSNSQEFRASYFASQQDFYQSYIDILMQMHKQSPDAEFDAAAFAVSERARARSLLEMLTESRADIRQGVDGSLLERERSLQQGLNARAAAQVRLLNGKHTPAQAEAAAKEIASIAAEYEEVRARIRASSPRYAALTQPQPLNLAEIQRQALDPDTLLLEYSLGDDASYLFVVSQTSIASYQLPKRNEIEAATRQVRDLLTAPQPRPGETEAKRQARIKEARANYWPQAAVLSQMLLGPASSHLGAKRLLIVADGVLQYLPFGSLPSPVRSPQSAIRNPQSYTPLIVEHEIVHAPSASALAVLRRELSGRQPAAKAVAVLADPVFSADDARVKPSNKAQADKRVSSDLTRAISDVRGELRRILMTRDEAETILSVTPRNGGFAALDFRANRATATSHELSYYRIVHFATHGLLNSEHPELTGLVLSLVDERGQPQDGFLRMHEIFNLRLPAELVVLSACKTGLGKEIKGEGLVGLTRGFMYAGAARVVASLWEVNDVATAELMKWFYRRMLQDGMRPAAALRAAQIEMWKKPQWQSPFYWGAFIIQGEWK